jgi:hypothetical protein
VIAKMISTIERHMLLSPNSSETNEALLECDKFWLREEAERQKTPYNPDAKSEWGKYVVIRASHDQLTDEWTNIGVMVFNKAGERVFCKIGPMQRAIARGDLNQGCGVDSFEAISERYQTMEDVEQALRSDGHYMSNIQLTGPRGTNIDLECCYQLWQKMVMGIN